MFLCLLTGNVDGLDKIINGFKEKRKVTIGIDAKVKTMETEISILKNELVNLRSELSSTTRLITGKGLHGGIRKDSGRKISRDSLESADVRYDSDSSNNHDDRSSNKKVKADKRYNSGQGVEQTIAKAESHSDKNVTADIRQQLVSVVGQTIENDYSSQSSNSNQFQHQSMAHNTQGMPHGSQGMSYGSQGMSHGGQGMSHGGQGMSHGGQGMSYSSQGMSHGGQDVSHGSQGRSQSSNGMALGGKGIAYGGQDVSHSGQGLSHGGQDMSHRGQGMAHGNQGMAHNSQVMSHGGQDLAHSGQGMAHNAQIVSHGGQGMVHNPQGMPHGSQDLAHSGQGMAHNAQIVSHGGQGMAHNPQGMPHGGHGMAHNTIYHNAVGTAQSAQASYGGQGMSHDPQDTSGTIVQQTVGYAPTMMIQQGAGSSLLATVNATPAAAVVASSTVLSPETSALFEEVNKGRLSFEDFKIIRGAKALIKTKNAN